MVYDGIKLPKRATLSKSHRKPKAALAQRSMLGQAAAAAKNRERAARSEIVRAFQRLQIPFHQWPEFVQGFYTDPSQRAGYHQRIAPSRFQAPAFDRLNQSPQDWQRLADAAWERHRNRFLSACEGWVALGVDEAIVEKRRRGSGKREPSEAEARRRGQNTPLHRRYEWAAHYLLGAPLKQIAGLDEDVSTVGRVARDIIRSAGWSTKARAERRSSEIPRAYQEFPKAKYHPTQRARIVHDVQEEAALGDGWSDKPIR